MATHLSELSVGHAYAPVTNTESNLTLYQKLEQQVDWLLALNLDWQALGIFTSAVMAIFATLFFLLLADSKSSRIHAAKKALPKV